MCREIHPYDLALALQCPHVRLGLVLIEDHVPDHLVQDGFTRKYGIWGRGALSKGRHYCGEMLTIIDVGCWKMRCWNVIDDDAVMILFSYLLFSSLLFSWWWVMSDDVIELVTTWSSKLFQSSIKRRTWWEEVEQNDEEKLNSLNSWTGTGFDEMKLLLCY